MQVSIHSSMPGLYGLTKSTVDSVAYQGEDAVMSSPPDEVDEKEYPCIIKVTDGKDFKLSTIVRASRVCSVTVYYSSNPLRCPCHLQINPGELEAFHTSYGTLLKSSMTTLKKRDKKKEKARHERALLRRRKLEEVITVEGPKRGAGRRKRQRRVQAIIKQGEARQKMAERDEARAKRSGQSNISGS
jgi:signal recognition particle subunit SRP14